MTDFLLELRSEEIPARMQEKAREDLARLLVAELDKAGLKPGAVETYATPRRLALIARDLPLETQPVREERKGPRADAPAQALEGFLRSTGLTRDQLEERGDGKGNTVLFAVTDKPGRATADVLAEAIPAVIRAFPWPKAMRWGDASLSTESLRWARPLQGIVALLGDDVVPVEIAGVVSGAATVGHRFHHPGVITIGSAADYAEKLRACHVIVDGAERRAIIAVGAKMAATKAGLTLVEDEGLLFENAGLTEWPVPLLGLFDPEFLSVPPEVIQLTARVNQKYFVCRDASGALANAFVCTANIEASDGGEKIVEGNQKVLAARLSDARFFYETDLKVPLEAQAEKLGKIVFHEKLGTVADKVDRVAKLARWLVEEGIVKSSPSSLGEDLAALAERAARLAKADLVTGMVGEFPELQGLMGGYYARAQGEDPRVADAIRDHYKPVGQGDDVPTAPVTVAVSLADKLDTLTGFFVVNEKPTGSRDPFALRRAALAVLLQQESAGVRIPLSRLFSKMDLILGETLARVQERRLQINNRSLTDQYVASLGSARPMIQQQDLSYVWPDSPDGGTHYVGAVAAALDLIINSFNSAAVGKTGLLDFFADRLKVQQREAGVRHDLIDAVFALGGEDDLVRLLARVHALQAFVTTDDGRNLLAGYKRAANILKKEAFAGPAERTALAYTPEPAETALRLALESAEPLAAVAIEREDFEGAMAALASLRGPIDAFFESVTVNDPAPEKRAARLGLLARMRDAVHRVADFAKIEG
jgi:glycyl-tRNA synthetase beta chain